MTSFQEVNLNTHSQSFLNPIIIKQKAFFKHDTNQALLRVTLSFFTYDSFTSAVSFGGERAIG
jgi:hypothetical protein